jgi:hypothetical protein
MFQREKTNMANEEEAWLSKITLAAEAEKKRMEEAAVMNKVFSRIRDEVYNEAADLISRRARLMAGVDGYKGLYDELMDQVHALRDKAKGTTNTEPLKGERDG